MRKQVFAVSFVLHGRGNVIIAAVIPFEGGCLTCTRAVRIVMGKLILRRKLVIYGIINDVLLDIHIIVVRNRLGHIRAPLPVRDVNGGRSQQVVAAIQRRQGNRVRELEFPDGIVGAVQLFQIDKS